MQKEIDTVDVIVLFWRRKWLIFVAAACAVLAAFLITTYVMTPTYEAAGKILLRQEKLDPANRLPSYEQDSLFFQNQKQIVSGMQLLESALDTLPVDFSEQDIVQLQKGLTVEIIRDSSVLLVSLEHPDKELVAPVVNALLRRYVDEYAQQKQSAVANALQAVSREIEDVKAQQAAAVSALNDFLRKEKIGVLPESEVAMYFSKYGDFDLAVTEAEAECEQAKMSLRSLETGLQANDSENIAESFLVSDPVLNDLKEKIRAATLQLEKLLTIYSPEHPDVVLATKSIYELRQTLARERVRLIEAERTRRTVAVQLSERKIEVLRQRQTMKSEELEKLLAQQPELSRLLSEVKIWRFRLDELFKTEGELRVFQTRTEQVPDMVFLERARTPTDPVSPDLPMNMLIAGLFGLVIGCGMVLALPYPVSRQNNQAQLSGEKNGADRRASVRSSRRGTAVVSLKGKEEKKYMCRSQDVSQTGTRVLSTEPIPLHSQVSMDMSGDGEPVMRKKGVVVWSAPYSSADQPVQYSVGINFCK